MSEQKLPKCRIYLFTYNRNQLLPRAVNSLLQQTVQDWVCELHNDNPEDPFPATYVGGLNDDRFIVVDHEVNLGPVRSFNLAFAGCDEPYASMLEDDNWWEPGFLETMMGILAEQPKLNVVWSNMRLWQEQRDNQWSDTKRSTWPVSDGTRFFNWPAKQQAFSALHSTSALLYRGSRASAYQVPENVLLNAVELIRERAFDHPLCLVQRPLANFAITFVTNRSANPYVWIANQIMMLASFVETAPNPEGEFKNSLDFYRSQQPSPIANFFLANVFVLKKATYLKYFSLRDWYITGKWLIRNGHQLPFIKKYLKSQLNVYDFLIKQTGLRFKESMRSK